MSIILNKSFHFVISVKINWVACKSDLIFILEWSFKWFDNKFNFYSAIRCKDFSWINFIYFKSPICNHNYSWFKICNINAWIFCFKIFNRSLCKVTSYKKEVVCYKKVGKWLFYIALYLFLWNAFRYLAEISVVFNHFRVKLLKCRLLRCILKIAYFWRCLYFYWHKIYILILIILKIKIVKNMKFLMWFVNKFWLKL
jgi:hypothetical protein